MKLAGPLLALSVAANVTLAALVYTRWSQPGPAPAASVPAPTAVAKTPPPALLPTPEGGRINSEVDDASLVAQLRTDGFPPEIIRMLIANRVQQRYAERIRNLAPKTAYAYWCRSNYSTYSAVPIESRPKLRELNRDMQAEIEGLLGTDAALSPYEKALRQRTLGNLPAEKVRRITAINNDYNDLSTQLREKTNGIMLQADREALRLLDQEKRADLAATLTPAELLEYDLRASQTANNVRQRLSNFEPTEEEYRAITQLNLELDRQFGTNNLSAQEQEQRRFAEQQLPAKIQALLPPERYADYLATTDGSYPENNAFLREAGFDSSVTKAVVTLRRSINQRADAIRQQSSLTREQRSAALAALAEEASAQLLTKLGDAGFASYAKAYQGQWINRLRPAPPTGSRP